MLTELLFLSCSWKMGLVNLRKNFPKSIHTLIIPLKVCVFNGLDGVEGMLLILLWEKAVLFKLCKNDCKLYEQQKGGQWNPLNITTFRPWKFGSINRVVVVIGVGLNYGATSFNLHCMWIQEGEIIFRDADHENMCFQCESWLQPHLQLSVWIL